MATSRRAALYVRVSTSDRGQTVENQLQPLQEAAGRLGWTVVAIYRDEGISGSKGRHKRPGLDALLKGVARREFDIVAAWSVCRLGRSLSDLIGLLGELRSRDVDLYLHQQALDTSTPSGRMLFGMLGVFSEFERAMIRDRVMAGLDRARSSGKRLGRPRTTPFQVQRIRLALDEGRGVRETARLLKVVRRQGERGQAHVGERDRLTPRSPHHGLAATPQGTGKQKSAFRPWPSERGPTTRRSVGSTIRKPDGIGRAMLHRTVSRAVARQFL